MKARWSSLRSTHGGCVFDCYGPVIPSPWVPARVGCRHRGLGTFWLAPPWRVQQSFPNIRRSALRDASPMCAARGDVAILCRGRPRRVSSSGSDRMHLISCQPEVIDTYGVPRNADEFPKHRLRDSGRRPTGARKLSKAFSRPLPADLLVIENKCEQRQLLGRRLRGRHRVSLLRQRARR